MLTRRGYDVLMCIVLLNCHQLSNRLGEVAVPDKPGPCTRRSSVPCHQWFLSGLKRSVWVRGELPMEFADDVIARRMFLTNCRWSLLQRPFHLRLKEDVRHEQLGGCLWDFLNSSELRFFSDVKGYKEKGTGIRVRKRNNDHGSVSGVSTLHIHGW